MAIEWPLGATCQFIGHARARSETGGESRAPAHHALGTTRGGEGKGRQNVRNEGRQTGASLSYLMLVIPPPPPILILGSAQARRNNSVVPHSVETPRGAQSLFAMHPILRSGGRGEEQCSRGELFLAKVVQHFVDVQFLLKFKFGPCGLERHANTCNVDNPDSEVAAGGGGARRRRAAAAGGGGRGGGGGRRQRAAAAGAAATGGGGGAAGGGGNDGDEGAEPSCATSLRTADETARSLMWPIFEFVPSYRTVCYRQSGNVGTI